MAVDWHPIEQLPTDRKDGRDLLLWDDRGAVVACWTNDGWDTGHLSEETNDTLFVETATHWADINRPGDDHRRGPTKEDDVGILAKKYNVKLGKSPF